MPPSSYSKLHQHLGLTSTHTEGHVNPSFTSLAESISATILHDKQQLFFSTVSKPKRLSCSLHDVQPQQLLLLFSSSCPTTTTLPPTPLQAVTSPEPLQLLLSSPPKSATPPAPFIPRQINSHGTPFLHTLQTVNSTSSSSLQTETAAELLFSSRAPRPALSSLPPHSFISSTAAYLHIENTEGSYSFTSPTKKISNPFLFPSSRNYSSSNSFISTSPTEVAQPLCSSLFKPQAATASSSFPLAETYCSFSSPPHWNCSFSSPPKQQPELLLHSPSSLL